MAVACLKTIGAIQRPDTIMNSASDTPTLVDYLRTSAQQHSDAEVLIQGERRVRYRELWADTCAVAHYLRGEGIETGERVALLLENSREYVASYYAVLAAGGVVVALNAAARARDLANWILHSGARWLIAHADHVELKTLLAALDGKVQVITVGASTLEYGGGVWSDIVAANLIETPPPSRQDTAAAIIYTSGTTGRPKGVVLTHRNLVSNVRSILAYLHLSAADRCLNVLPFYYSYGNSVLHTHIAVGGSLVLENSLAYVHQVFGKIGSEQATGFAGVPSTYALLLSRVDIAQHDCRSLRYATQAGGAMRPTLIRQFRNALPHVDFYVMYGQTEATARLTYLPPSQLEQKLGSAGMAIPGVRLEIRNDGGHKMPSGTIGEVYATGPNIMQGYWNDPQATNEVLKDGWLKTGDLAYMDDDGYVYIQGRSVDMIKTGAHRVNPADIEEVVAAIDGVAEVAVVGVADDILGQTIKAVIVPTAGAKLEPMTVKAHCHARLASYKVPKHVEFVARLPKTASGKIQRYLLTNETSRGLGSNGQ